MPRASCYSCLNANVLPRRQRRGHGPDECNDASDLTPPGRRLRRADSASRTLGLHRLRTELPGIARYGGHLGHDGAGKHQPLLLRRQLRGLGLQDRWRRGQRPLCERRRLPGSASRRATTPTSSPTSAALLGLRSGVANAIFTCGVSNEVHDLPMKAAYATRSDRDWRCVAAVALDRADYRSGPRANGDRRGRSGDRCASRSPAAVDLLERGEDGAPWPARSTKPTPSFKQSGSRVAWTGSILWRRDCGDAVGAGPLEKRPCHACNVATESSRSLENLRAVVRALVTGPEPPKRHGSLRGAEPRRESTPKSPRT